MLHKQVCKRARVCVCVHDSVLMCVKERVCRWRQLKLVPMVQACPSLVTGARRCIKGQ